MNADAIVVGGGFWGCTVARRLAEAGQRVIVLEKRLAIGGNCRCETDPATGIECHVYGSHIFHTSNPDVWAFVNRFTSFNEYRHVVLARHAGKTYHLPIGRTLYREFGTDDRTAIFAAFVRNYTAKQWGMPAEQVDSAVIGRLIVRDTDSVRYFDDTWEGIPSDGYNRLFERMLDHPNITVRCNCSFVLGGEQTGDARLYYSGPIDALFGYRFGALPWRTLRFETERVSVSDLQHNAVVNYVDADVPYTRQHEYKHYHPEWRHVMSAPETIVCREYPAVWQPGDEPYYPISSAESLALYARYRDAALEIPGLTVGGRLGGYRYLDMDKTISEALSLQI